MARSISLVITPFLIASCCIMAGSCATTYVRVPAVCPHDPLCLDERPDAGPAARTREDGYIRRHAESTVEVRGLRYLPNQGIRTQTGIGALIGARGYVLTAYHLVEGASSVTVALHASGHDGGTARGREIPAIPLMLSREEDVALLLLPSGERLPPSLPIRSGPVITNDDVRFIGAGAALKRGRVIDADITEGIDRSFADARISASAEDSGAPVMNVCGEIVGVALGPFGKKGALRFVTIDRALKALSLTPADLR
ncbi:MAG: Trypsin-like peptidase domain [Candidatus Parcubacteria bacterium]|jgi:S1-C subfamily serine protease